MWRWWVLASGVVLAGCAKAVAPPEPVVLMAASSTAEACRQIVDPSLNVEGRFASTSTLARQILEGAPTDLFLSASKDWADEVQRKAPTIKRITLLGNSLVVIQNAQSGDKIAKLDDLASDSIRHIGLADPQSVPAGIYARQAIEKSGLWVRVKERVVSASDVRAALLLAERGEVDAALVYLTDAVASKSVRVAMTVDPSLHDPIEYPLLLLSDCPQARAAFDALCGPKAKEIFEKLKFRFLANP